MFYQDRPMGRSMKNALMERGGISPSFGEAIQGGGTPKRPMLAGLKDLFSPSAMRAGYSDEPERPVPAQNENAGPGDEYRAGPPRKWAIEGGDFGVSQVMLTPNGEDGVWTGFDASGKKIRLNGYIIGGKGYAVLPSGHEVEFNLEGKPVTE